MTWGAFIFHVLLEVEVYTLVLQKNMYFQVSPGPTKFKIPCIYIDCGLMTEYIFIWSFLQVCCMLMVSEKCKMKCLHDQVLIL